MPKKLYEKHAKLVDRLAELNKTIATDEKTILAIVARGKSLRSDDTLSTKYQNELLTRRLLQDEIADLEDHISKA